MSNAAQNETLGSYEKKTIKAEKQYISAHVSFADNANGSLSCIQFKQFTIHALDCLHGQFGAAIMFDVLEVSHENVGLIRVHTSEALKLQTALTCLSKYNDRRCAVRILQTSAFLGSLGCSSRCWDVHNNTTTRT
eukprot:m.166441 g.166441  ORF g.166441 m.166441 type:complete len:135 (-) comp31428_c1_seq1:124-528(-)